MSKIFINTGKDFQEQIAIINVWNENKKWYDAYGGRGKTFGEAMHNAIELYFKEHKNA